MTRRKLVKPAAAVAALAAFILAAMLSSSSGVKAIDDDDYESKIRRGFEIAPVHLNLEGKNRSLVGLGSYIVNANVPCNECHGAGPAINQFLPGDNPYYGQTAVINPATYLGGGRDFGAPVPGSAHIISRTVCRPDATAKLSGWGFYSSLPPIAGGRRGTLKK
jgi:hypothetical protein